MRLSFLSSILCLLYAVISPSLCAQEHHSYEQARAAYDERRLDKALSYLQEVVQEEPENVEAYVLRGEVYYYRQELRKARESWEKALQIAPSRQDVKEALDRLKKEEPIEELLTWMDTSPFVVRFSQGRMPLDVGQLRQLLRQVYRLSGQRFQYFPHYPIPLILYTESDFEKVRNLTHQVGGLYDGKIRLPLRESPSRQVLSVSDPLARVLWHEYAHLIVHDIAKGRCPLWLNEGIAVLQEAEVSSPSLEEFKSAFHAQKILSWERLWTEHRYPVESLELRYQQAYLITRYLVERGGWGRLVSLLSRLGHGDPLEEAMKAEYQLAPTLLEKRWREWVANLL